MSRHKQTADQLIGGGVADPRLLPTAIEHAIEDVSIEEGLVLVNNGVLPTDYQVLRFGAQGLQLFEAAPNVDGLQLRALFPKVLKMQHSLLVRTPAQEAEDFQAAMAPGGGLIEIRIVFKKDALHQGDKNE